MTNDDLQSLGAMLRQAREEHALTLEEVEAQTRIRIKFLQALESGDLSPLPSVAHAKGFLRNYAQFLKLDANAVTARFGELTGTGAPSVTTTTAAPAVTPPAVEPAAPGTIAPAFDEEEAAAAPPTGSPAAETPLTPYPPPPALSRPRATYIPVDQRVGPAGPVGVPTPAPRKRPFPTPPGGIPFPAAAAAPEVIQPERPQTGLRRLLQSSLIIGAVLAVGMIAIVVWVIAQLSAVQGDQLAQTPEAALGATFSANSTQEPSPSFAPTLTPTVTSGPPIPLDRVLLTIKVVQRTWAKIVVDGKTVFQGQAEGGQVLQYQGQAAIQVLVGNAAAFDINYNGQDLGLLGDVGQVAERTFTPSGLITPTATLTVTPTSTLVPTPTERGTQAPTPKP